METQINESFDRAHDEVHYFLAGPNLIGKRFGFSFLKYKNGNNIFKQVTPGHIPISLTRPNFKPENILLHSISCRMYGRLQLKITFFHDIYVV